MEQRRNYKGVGNAFVQIVKADGVSGLFRGATPTIVRAMALNMGMLASNEQVRSRAVPGVIAWMEQSMMPLGSWSTLAPCLP